GIDETFSQTVHARSSYKPTEIVFGEKFVNIYNDVDEKGIISIDVRKLSETEPSVDEDYSHTQTWHHTGHFAGYAPRKKWRGGGREASVRCGFRHVGVG